LSILLEAVALLPAHRDAAARQGRLRTGSHGVGPRGRSLLGFGYLAGVCGGAGDRAVRLLEHHGRRVGPPAHDVLTLAGRASLSPGALALRHRRARHGESAALLRIARGDGECSCGGERAGVRAASDLARPTADPATGDRGHADSRGDYARTW